MSRLLAMPYAITLRFVEPAAARLGEMQRAIADGIGDHRVVELGYPAHVTLAVLPDSASRQAVEDTVCRVTEGWHVLPIILGGLGIFPGAAPTIWAASAATEQLLAYHGTLIAALGSDGVHPHYQVGAWVPHVTLCQAEQASATRAIEIASALWQGAMRGRLDQVDMVRFSPVDVLRSLPLATAAGA